MAQFRSKPFGVTKNGDKVDEYIISNPGGLEISVPVSYTHLTLPTILLV